MSCYLLRSSMQNFIGNRKKFRRESKHEDYSIEMFNSNVLLIFMLCSFLFSVQKMLWNNRLKNVLIIRYKCIYSVRYKIY